MVAAITASQLYAHLQCPHRVALDAVGDPSRRDPVSPIMQLLWERGTAHEQDVIGALGQPFLDLSTLSGDEKEAATRAALQRGEPVIHGGRITDRKGRQSAQRRAIARETPHTRHWRPSTDVIRLPLPLGIEHHNLR